jgi:hypothetical protein
MAGPGRVRFDGCVHLLVDSAVARDGGQPRVYHTSLAHDARLEDGQRGRVDLRKADEDALFAHLERQRGERRRDHLRKGEG